MCRWLEYEVDKVQIGMRMVIMHCPLGFVEYDGEIDRNFYNLSFVSSLTEQKWTHIQAVKNSLPQNI
jgi:hypothetical protein